MIQYKFYLLMFAIFSVTLVSSGIAQPPSISNSLVMSYDSSNIDGSNNSTLTNGQTLASWQDNSGNGLHLSTVSGTPLYVQSFAQSSPGFPALPVVSFDFTDTTADFLTGSAASNVLSGYPVTIFFVSTFEDQTNGGARQGTASVFSIGNNAAGDQYLLAGPNDPDQINNGTSVFASAQYRNGFDPLATSTQNLNDGDVHIGTARYQASNSINIRVDGRQGPTNTAFDLAFPGATVWRIGNTGNNTPAQAELNGRVGEVLVYNGYVNGADLDMIEDYLRAKWRGVLPDGVGNLTYTSQTSGFTFPTTGTATIVNNGLADLTITSLTADAGSFPTDALTIESLSFPINVAADGGTFQFDVGWVPTDDLGVRDFTITAASNNPNPLVVDVNATVLGGVSNGLVVYYNFDETTGNVINDQSPEGDDNDGDVIGNSIDQQTTPSLNAGFGQAYRATNGGATSPYNNTNYVSIDGTLNGTRDAAGVPDLHFGTAPFSVSCWVFYEQANTPGENETVFGNVDWNRSAEAGGTRDGITLFRQNATIAAIYADSTGFGVGEFRWFLGNFNPGVWHHWVITGKPGDARAYYNGALVGTQLAISGDIGNSIVPFILGNNAVPGGAIGGVTNTRFDEFGAWHRALDAAEVLQIFEQGRDQGVTLLNVGPQPSVQVTDNRGNLPDVLAMGATYTLIVSITNSGQAPLIIGPGMTITGADASLISFNPSFDNLTSTTVNPGQSLNVPLDFIADAGDGEINAVLNFTHNTALTGDQTSYVLTVPIVSLPNAVRRDNWALYR